MGCHAEFPFLLAMQSCDGGSFSGLALQCCPSPWFFPLLIATTCTATELSGVCRYHEHLLEDLLATVLHVCSPRTLGTTIPPPPLPRGRVCI